MDNEVVALSNLTIGLKMDWIISRGDLIRTTCDGMAVKQLTVDNNEDEARNSIDNATAEGLMEKITQSFRPNSKVNYPILHESPYNTGI